MMDAAAPLCLTTFLDYESPDYCRHPLFMSADEPSVRSISFGRPIESPPLVLTKARP